MNIAVGEKYSKFYGNIEAGVTQPTLYGKLERRSTWAGPSRMNRTWSENAFSAVVQYMGYGASPAGSNPDSAMSQLPNWASYFSFDASVVLFLFLLYNTNRAYLKGSHEQKWVKACIVLGTGPVVWSFNKQ